MLRPRYPHERPDQHVVDLLGEQEADDEHHREGEERPDQPRAQLDQVLHQGRLGGLDVLVGHAALPASGVALDVVFCVGDAAASLAGAGADAGSAGATGAGSLAGGGGVAAAVSVLVCEAGVSVSGVSSACGGLAAFSMSLRMSSIGSKCA